jgi:hypothetical protein
VQFPKFWFIVSRKIWQPLVDLLRNRLQTFQVHHLSSGGQLPLLRVTRFPPGARLGAAQGPRHARHGMGQDQGHRHLLVTAGQSLCKHSGSTREP